MNRVWDDSDHRRTTFRGTLRFRRNRRLTAEQAADWHNLCYTNYDFGQRYPSALHFSRPGAPVLWLPSLDRGGLQTAQQPSQWDLALTWIQYIQTKVLPNVDLSLEGEVWYQGTEAMDSGRFYVDSTGNVVKQTIKKCPGVIGAATRGDIGLLQKLPVSKLKDVDGFGRTPVMLAARYNNWQALIFLLQQPGIEWQQASAVSSRRYGRENVLHILAENLQPPSSKAQLWPEIFQTLVALLPADLPSAALNASDVRGFVPLTRAIHARNEAMFDCLLQRGADPNFGGEAPPNESNCLAQSSPLAHAVERFSPYFTQRLLQAGATLYKRSENGKLCRRMSDGMLLPYTIRVKLSLHIPPLVYHGADLHRLHNDSDTDIWQLLHKKPRGEAEFLALQDLKHEVDAGLAPRRHLVVMALATCSHLHLTQDVLRLICQLADLML